MGKKSVDIRIVRRWAQQFKQGEGGKANSCDKPRLVRPVTATDESQQEFVEEII